MAFFPVKCPKEDPLLKMLRDVYHATPLRIPDSTTKVLDVIAHRGKKSMRYGPVSKLLNVDKEPVIEESPLPQLSVAKSNDVKVSFGLGLMSQMLKGFGMTDGNLAANLDGVTEISISIEDPRKLNVSPIEIGELLHGKKLDQTKAAANIFMRDNKPFEMLVITNVLIGNKISFHLKGSGNKAVDVNVPGIKGVLKETEVDVKNSSTTDKKLIFGGKIPLTFAFSCIRLRVDAAGTLLLDEIVNPPVPKSVGSDEMVPGPDQPKEISLMHPKLPALIEFDEEL